MNIIPAIQDLQNEAAAWRQNLHQNPQTRYEEIYASQFVKKSWRHGEFLTVIITL